MGNLENQELSPQELLKNFRTPKKVDIPGSLLYTPMGSYYKVYENGQFVRLRIIDLTVPGEATISVLAWDTWYSEVVERDKAIACMDMSDIILKNGKYQFVSEKYIDIDGVPVDYEGVDIPPFDAETGAPNAFMRHAPRNTRIVVDNEVKIVQSRTLYYFEDNTAKFVVKTFDGDIFEDYVPPANSGALLVPGDFVIYRNKINIHIVNIRTMLSNDYVSVMTATIPNLNP